MGSGGGAGRGCGRGPPSGHAPGLWNFARRFSVAGASGPASTVEIRDMNHCNLALLWARVEEVGEKMGLFWEYCTNIFFSENSKKNTSL